MSPGIGLQFEETLPLAAPAHSMTTWSICEPVAVPSEADPVAGRGDGSAAVSRLQRVNSTTRVYGATFQVKTPVAGRRRR